MAKVEADEVASRGWHIAEGVDSRNARPTHRNKIPYASWSRGKLFTPMPSIRGTTKGFHSMSMSGNQLIAFLSPTIGLIFTAFLLPLWLNNRSRSYIPYFVVAFVLYTLATSSQLFLVPGDTGRTAPITSIFYLSCIVLLTEGCLKRRNRDTSYRLTAAICGVSLIGVCYYYFADRNLITRIYILSVGCGLLFAIAAYRLRPSRDSCLVDKAIFWIFLLMSAQIFLRPLLIGRPGDANIDPDAFRTSPFWLALQFSLVVSAVVMGLTLLGAIFTEITADLKQQSTIDALTCVYNRRGFDEEASRAIKTGGSNPISLVVCDIDHFKAINDTQGHPRGDRVLKELALLLSAQTRESDLVGRIGGEEFAVLLRGCTPQEAVSYSERVRGLFEETGSSALRGSSTITASFGIADHISGETLRELMSRADQQLYAAKRSGRNRVCAEGNGIEYRASA
ncbi:MAG: hypothetical protein K0Q60_3464 [Microvirga sp.]|jgi:diguanylate cyclase (GGDEF)-like protein|nr:hypothetical protein [Microvirga sp.]